MIIMVSNQFPQKRKDYLLSLVWVMIYSIGQMIYSGNLLNFSLSQKGPILLAGLRSYYYTGSHNISPRVSCRRF